MPRVASALLLVLCLAGLSACGGGDDGPSDQDLENARQEGRKEERERQELRELRRRTRELERQSRERRRSGGGSSASASGGSSAGGSSAGRGDDIPDPVAGGKSCGDGLRANANTSCAFAQNVRGEYGSNPGAGSIQVFSPVTGQSYTMSCYTAGGTVTCSGGNNARASFPG